MSTEQPTPLHGRYGHIAALGSSFAAGPGIDPIVSTTAGRSGRNYAHLLAASLGAELTDLSVSGATTSTILDTEQKFRGTTFPPQISGLPADADLVTITAGGNDLKYALSLLKAGWGGWFRGHTITRWMGNRLLADALPEVGPELISDASAGLARIADEVHRRAPHARILLVEYLTVIGPDTKTSPEVPFDDAMIAGFRTVGLRLSEAFQRAATQSVAELVPISSLSVDHAVGSKEPWVSGFKPSFKGVPAFHPNAAGMRAVAAAVGTHLGHQP